VAEVVDVTNPLRSDEEAEFPLNQLDDEDQRILSVGATFDWTIGFDLLSGERKQFSLIRLRRLPRWTQDEIKAIRKEAAEIVKSFD
jgi:hypothetical protein